MSSLRAIGSHRDESWRASLSKDPELTNESIIQGARWLADQVNSSKSKSIPVLCLDTNGAVCSWVKPDEADTKSLHAIVSESDEANDEDDLDHESHHAAMDRFPKLPLELSLDPLQSKNVSSGSRAAIMANPDIPARLLKDELDRLGIGVETTISLWHAIARVWDPSARSTGSSAERIVASNTPVCATIVVDPDTGRLIWSWSKAGQLITAGSSRIERIQIDQDSKAVVRQEDISRLCSDWLSWSSQLGVSPSRIVFVGEPTQIQTIPNESDASSLNSDEQSEPNGLTPSEVGSALSQRWTNSSVDLIAHSDPIGETMSRLASISVQELESISTLEHRPGRAHRSMYRWGSFAMIAISLIIWIAAFEFFSQTDSIQERISAVANERLTVLSEHDPELMGSMIPSQALQDKLDQIRRSSQPIVQQQNKPILEELETISYVLGRSGIKVENITLNNSTVSLVIRTENDIQLAEDINQSLTAISGSNLRWYNMNPARRGDHIEVTFSARWDEKEEGGS